MYAGLLQQEWNCYYYVLRSINGPVYWSFSPPPGDGWACHRLTQLCFASAHGIFPDATLSVHSSSSGCSAEVRDAERKATWKREI